MKKTYLTPLAVVIECKPANMIAATLTSGGDDDPDAPNSAESHDLMFMDLYEE